MGCWRPTGSWASSATREVVELVVQGEFALLHERLNARRPEPIHDDIAAIEFIVLVGG